MGHLPRWYMMLQIEQCRQMQACKRDDGYEVHGEEVPRPRVFLIYLYVLTTLVIVRFLYYTPVLYFYTG